MFSNESWKIVLGLLVLSLFSGTLALAADEKAQPNKEQPQPPRNAEPEMKNRRVSGIVQLQLDLIRALQQRRQMKDDANSSNRSTRSDARLGVRLEQPAEAVVDQLDLPKGVGLIVNEVVPDSPADKVGIKINDILLEVDSKPVPSDAKEFVKELGAVKPNTPVDAVVLRRGKRETLKGLSFPEGRAQANPAPPPIPGNREREQPQVPQIRLPLLPVPGLLPGMPANPNRRVPAAPLPLPLPIP